MASVALPAILPACSTAGMPMLNPIGTVASAQLELLMWSTLIMLSIIVPVIMGTLWIVWHYRSTSGKATYDPEFRESKFLHGVTLFAPLVIIIALGGLNWVYTHRLDPYRPVDAEERPFEIQAVSLDYKWLFIYPDAGVATVNELVAPVDEPVTIRITSDPMMTALFIPGLTSQIYAMPGMETRANFHADREGVLDGANAMFSGPGFENQRFETRLLGREKFDNWIRSMGAGSASLPDDAEVKEVKNEPLLDMAGYRKLAERTQGYPLTHFASVETGLFAKIVRLFDPGIR